MTEYQLREYKVKEGEMDALIEAWRTSVVPLRRKLGFHVVGAWVSRKENRFVWIVGWDGSGSFEEAAKRYYDSPERNTMKPDPASFLAEMDTIMVSSVSA